MKLEREARTLTPLEISVNVPVSIPQQSSLFSDRKDYTVCGHSDSGFEPRNPPMNPSIIIAARTSVQKYLGRTLKQCVATRRLYVSCLLPSFMLP